MSEVFEPLWQPPHEALEQVATIYECLPKGDVYNAAKAIHMASVNLLPNAVRSTHFRAAPAVQDGHGTCYAAAEVVSGLALHQECQELVPFVRLNRKYDPETLRRGSHAANTLVATADAELITCDATLGALSLTEQYPEDLDATDARVAIMEDATQPNAVFAAAYYSWKEGNTYHSWSTPDISQAPSFPDDSTHHSVFMPAKVGVQALTALAMQAHAVSLNQNPSVYAALVPHLPKLAKRTPTGHTL